MYVLHSRENVAFSHYNFETGVRVYVKIYFLYSAQVKLL